jgi:hypothetical protein
MHGFERELPEHGAMPRNTRQSVASKHDQGFSRS